MTVLRETHEEIGIEASSVDIWGPGPTVGREDMTVTPFLGYVGDVDPHSLKINSEEVKMKKFLEVANICQYLGRYLTKPEPSGVGCMLVSHQCDC